MTNTTSAERVTVTKVGDAWRVAWQVPPFGGNATWDFDNEERARKAARVIAAWHRNP